MKYVLLVFGLLLAIGGGFTFAASYGTMLDGNMGGLIGVIGISGGILVIGQVFVLQSLEALRASFERGLDARHAPHPVDTTHFAAESYDQHDHGAAPPFDRAAPAFAGNATDEPEARGAFAQHQEPAVQMGAETAAAEPKWAPEPAEPDHQKAYSEAAAPPRIPNIDTELLFEAAMASPSSARTPVETSTEASAETHANTAEGPAHAAFDTSAPALSGSAPKTSPSLSDMWRRVTARNGKSANEAEAEELPPPPPIPIPARPVAAPAAVAEETAATDHFAAPQAEYPQGNEANVEEPTLLQLPPAHRQFAAAHNAAPQDTAPRVAAPQDTPPQDTPPQDTAPQDTAPQDKAPQDTAPQDTVPHDAAPQGAFGPHQPDVHDAELGDWFDRALAGLDDHAPPPPLQRDGVDLDRSRTVNATGSNKSERDADGKPVERPIFPHPAPAEPRVAPFPEKPSRPVAAKEPEPAVAAKPESAAHPTEMGRYQADGTTYVMYSDGSIEAQTEQGVYRFGSMAELKAFFDDQTVAAT